MAWKIEHILERFGISREQSIGLALSGGGAKGLSHIGVFKAMEQFNMKPHVMSGVSAGSIAAVMYAAGLTPDEMMECFSQASLGDFMEWSLPKRGFMKLDRFAKQLESWLPVHNLEELNIPTIVCATDFDHGKSVGWGKGEIVPRVIASCSIPIVFNPVRINGVNYVDGGVLRNLPAWAIRDYCDTLFGVNCSPLGKFSPSKAGIIDISYRTFKLMMKANVPQDIRLCDHLIRIEQIDQVRVFDLKALKKAVTLGYDSACRVLEEINKRK